MNIHSKYDLNQMQSLPLEAKIIMTQRRIQDWVDYWDGNVYVSFSGGKDSTVLKHIVDGMYDNIPAAFVNTGLEYPEIQQFVHEIKSGKYNCFNSDVEIIRPEMRFDAVIKKYGYPVISKEVAKQIYYAKRGSDWAINNLNGVDRYGNAVYFKQQFKKYSYLKEAPFGVSHYCCDVMKKKPIKKYETVTSRKPFVGTMAAESTQRMQGWLKTGCNAYESKRPMSKPLSFWTEQDVLAYIREKNLPIAKVYGEILEDENGHLKTTGCDRTGCMFCMFGCHLEKEPNRFQRMKETHPKQYAYCMEQLGLKEVLEYIGVPYK